MIYSERVRLRRDERTDIQLFTTWLNDPDVYRYLGTVNLPLSTANEEQWFDNMLKRPIEEQPLAIEIKESGGWRLVGNCGFMDIRWTIRSAEVGILIGDKTCWNKGYGTEVMRMLLQVGFGTLNLNRIFLQVDEGNLGGIRAYEKAGFTHEGRFREGAFLAGKYCDILLMSVLRSEWSPEK